MSEMVERVAKVLWDYGHTSTETWADLISDCPTLADFLRGKARAVIAAMSEPTEAMQIAGHNVRSDPKTGMPTLCGTDEIYTAMIHAGIAEDTP